MSEEEVAETSPRELRDLPDALWDEVRDLPDALWDEVRVVMPLEKQAISIRLDRDILDYFRAAGPRYQSQINAVLRSYVDHVTADTPPRRKRAG
jgi:uncharacterized protein (DUF4415 family)